MVERRAWMSDHRPQKKWDARENLRSQTFDEPQFDCVALILRCVDTIGHFVLSNDSGHTC